MRVRGYVVEAHVARGGMGDVHRARVEATGELVAIKVMRHAGEGGDDAAARVRFEREGRILAELTHPAIVRYVAHGTTLDGRPYLASEWLDGEALDAHFATKRMSARETATLGSTLAGALAAAHDVGIVHRDVKPSNVVLATDGSAKLLDFGIAKTSSGEPALTRDGALVGTRGYMAPEQLRGSADVAAPADVYGLGCVLFRALSGTMPWIDADELTSRSTAVTAADVMHVRPDVTIELAEAIACMLHAMPEMRPTAHDVARDLARIAASVTNDPAPVSHREPVSREEQALVTVVVVAATGPAEVTEVDPDSDDDANANANANASTSARALFEERGARAEVLPHGACVAVFGAWAGGIGEQVAVAARAALDVKNDVAPERLVVLTTGRAELTGASATGDAVARALDALRTAPNRGVSVDDASAGLLASRFVVRAEARAHVLVEERAEDPIARRVCGRVVPFVGRDAELDALVRSARAAFDEGRAGGARVVGTAGAGKSRLAAEVGARVKRADARVTIVTTRSDPLGAGAPFAAAAAIARDLRDLREPAEKNAAAGSFTALLAGRGEDEAERAARVDPALMRDRLREAFRDAVEGAAKVAPLLLVLDDVQWVDAASMRLVEDVIDRGRGPLFVLSLARPDADAPGARSARRLGSMELAPIDASAAAALARAVTGDGASATTIDRIVRLGDGNAFFLEELARAAATGGSTPLPESVVALTQSRLAAFPPLARRVLRAASIVRPRVTEAAVAHLVGAGAAREEIAATLDDLVRSEVLVRRDASFDFRHELLAEAAYATLTENDARRGHLAAAAFAESTGSADPRRVAEHLERGGDRPRAAVAFARAAELTLRSGDVAGAIACADRAEHCGATGDMLGRVLAVRASVERWHGDVARAVVLGASALDLLDASKPAFSEAAADVATAAGAGGDEATLARIASRLLAGPTQPEAWRIRALAAAALSLVRVGGVADADRVLARAESMRETLVHDHAIADIGLGNARAARRTYAGEPAAYLVIMPSVIESASRVGDTRTACLARAHLGYGHAAVGAWKAAEETLLAAREEAEGLGLPAATASVLHNLARVYEVGGDIPGAAELQTQALAAALEQRNTRLATACRLYLARNARLAGDAARARDHAVTAFEGARERPLRAWAESLLADVLLELGDSARALGHAQAAWAFYEATGGIGEADATLHLALVRVLFASGEVENARTALIVARDRLLSRARTIADHASAETFLTAVEESAATIALCRREGIAVDL